MFKNGSGYKRDFVPLLKNFNHIYIYVYKSKKIQWYALTDSMNQVKHNNIFISILISGSLIIYNPGMIPSHIYHS